MVQNSALGASVEPAGGLAGAVGAVAGISALVSGEGMVSAGAAPVLRAFKKKSLHALAEI